jgi:hypothetical protein
MKIRRVMLWGFLGVTACVVPTEPEGDGTEGEIESAEQPIINGTPLASDDVGLTLIQYDAADGQTWMCSGTLLNDRWILTARHCADGVLSTYLFAVGPTSTAHPARIDHIHLHPTLDVALLHTSLAVKNPASGKPFSNVLRTDAPSTLVGKTLDCRGYGLSSLTDDNSTGTLRQGLLKVSKATSSTLTLVPNGMQQIMASGDSGGSCFYTTNGVRYLAGVHSRSVVATYYQPPPARKVIESNELVASSAFSRWVDQHLRRRYVADYTGDRRDDYAMWLRDTAEVSMKPSYGGSNALKPIGQLGDVPINGDWDGDGKTDYATFRPSDRRWSILKSSNNSLMTAFFGDAGDKPLVGDFDGDGITDLVTFGGGIFKVRESGGATWTREWSAPDELPVIGDYNGDSRDDIGTFKDGWWGVQTSGYFDYISKQIGASGDKPVPGDYDGDRVSDVALWRPSTGRWTIERSSDRALVTRTWGSSSDLPVPGDYDGDGKTDMAYYRASNRTWNVIKSSTGSTYSVTWGVSNSTPVQAPLGNR